MPTARIPATRFRECQMGATEKDFLQPVRSYLVFGPLAHRRQRPHQLHLDHVPLAATLQRLGREVLVIDNAASVIIQAERLQDRAGGAEPQVVEFPDEVDKDVLACVGGCGAVEYAGFSRNGIIPHLTYAGASCRPRRLHDTISRNSDDKAAGGDLSGSEEGLGH